MQRDAGAGADLVTNHHTGQQFVRAGPAFLLHQRNQGRYHTTSDVALGQLVTVMSIKRIDGHGIGKRCPGGAGIAAIPPDGGTAAAELAGCMIANDARQLRAAAACGHA
jgi:hypothetical protein